MNTVLYDREKDYIQIAAFPGFFRNNAEPFTQIRTRSIIHPDQ